MPVGFMGVLSLGVLGPRCVIELNSAPSAPRPVFGVAAGALKEGVARELDALVSSLIGVWGTEGRSSVVCRTC